MNTCSEIMKPKETEDDRYLKNRIASQLLYLLNLSEIQGLGAEDGTPPVFRAFNTEGREKSVEIQTAKPVKRMNLRNICEKYALRRLFPVTRSASERTSVRDKR